MVPDEVSGGLVMLDAVVRDAGGVVAVPVLTDELVTFPGVTVDEPTTLI